MFITIQTRDGKSGLTHTTVFHPFSDIQIFFCGPRLVTIESHREHIQHLNICPSASSIRARESSLRHWAEKLILAPNPNSTRNSKAPQEGRTTWPNGLPSSAEGWKPCSLCQVSEGSHSVPCDSLQSRTDGPTQPLHTHYENMTPHISSFSTSQQPNRDHKRNKKHQALKPAH